MLWLNWAPEGVQLWMQSWDRGCVCSVFPLTLYLHIITVICTFLLLYHGQRTNQTLKEFFSMWWLKFTVAEIHSLMWIRAHIYACVHVSVHSGSCSKSMSRPNVMNRPTNTRYNYVSTPCSHTTHTSLHHYTHHNIRDDQTRSQQRAFISWDQVQSEMCFWVGQKVEKAEENGSHQIWKVRWYFCMKSRLFVPTLDHISLDCMGQNFVDTVKHFWSALLQDTEVEKPSYFKD